MESNRYFEEIKSNSDKIVSETEKIFYSSSHGKAIMDDQDFRLTLHENRAKENIKPLLSYQRALAINLPISSFAKLYNYISDVKQESLNEISALTKASAAIENNNDKAMEIARKIAHITNVNLMLASFVSMIQDREK